MSRPAKKCIYCGKSGVTKEHLWGQWSRKSEYYKAHSSGYERNIHEVTVGRPHEVRKVSKGHADRQGSPRALQLKVVCKTCNGGWMSKIIQAAKPALLRLERGQVWAMNVQERAAVAAWVTMCVITWEQADRRTAAIDQNQRAIFMLTKCPPPNFHVFIGVYDWATRREFIHHKGLYTQRKDAQVPVGKFSEGIGNLQSTTFNFGHMVAHCISYRENSIIFKPDIYGVITGLQQIWPKTYSLQKVLMAHDDISLDIVSHVLEGYLSVTSMNELAVAFSTIEQNSRSPDDLKQIYELDPMERCKVALRLKNVPHPLINKGFDYSIFVDTLEITNPPAP